MKYIITFFCLMAIAFCQEKTSLQQTINHLETILENAKKYKQLEKQVQELTAKNEELKKQIPQKGSRGWTFKSINNDYSDFVHIISLSNKKSTRGGWYGYKDDLSIYIPQKGYIDFSAQGFFPSPNNYSTAYWWIKVIINEKVLWTMKWNGDGVIKLDIDKSGHITLESGSSTTQVFSGDKVPVNRPFRYDKWRYPNKFYNGQMDKILSRIPEKTQTWKDKDTYFNDKNWNYYQTNNKQYPVADGNTVTLTPDDRTEAAAAVWYKKEVSIPFAVAFEYSIYDNDGGINNIYNSADGFVFMFAKNAKKYNNPPTGGDCGFKKDGTGYGVFFTTYESRRIMVRDGNDSLITDKWDKSIYTHGKWRKVKIVVYANKINVYLDKNSKPTISHEYKWNNEYKNIGFSAATGGADSEHKIRNVFIAPLLRKR
ncbi:hypothetical protein [Candidatus Uabimicrobium sp. HlEnr_7]|uniref:hypothetical protein n=1 Tax=Candidatus Uabimicrobium helgolandensis TaxID=3095367 RepID=UPI003556F336